MVVQNRIWINLRTFRWLFFSSFTVLIHSESFRTFRRWSSQVPRLYYIGNVGNLREVRSILDMHSSVHTYSAHAKDSSKRHIICYWSSSWLILPFSIENVSLNAREQVNILIEVASYFYDIVFRVVDKTFSYMHVMKCGLEYLSPTVNN